MELENFVIYMRLKVKGEITHRTYWLYRCLPEFLSGLSERIHAKRNELVTPKE